MENARFQLEELDRIEQALVARIRRSGQWLPPQFRTKFIGKARKLSARECALQRWEAAKLVERHEEVIRQIDESVSLNLSEDFDSELKQCLALSDIDAASSLALSYAQHRSSRGRDRFVSDRTEHVISEFDKLYPPEEQWGHVLRLEPFYRALVTADGVTSKPQSYRDYLTQFDHYANFGDEKLAEYLTRFYNRAYSVGPGSEASDLPAVREALEATRSDPLFCQACNHGFSNQAVFNAHRAGRKHKRAELVHKETTTTTTALTPRYIRALSRALQPAFVSTIADIDRKAGMTIQERRLEVEALEHERQLEDAMISDDEGQLEHTIDTGHTKQLLGPEGTPIPRWLYKLHGLSTTFKCEICQPHAKIAGRAQFERHFRDAKHLQSLKLLGIAPSDAYKGITTISDALDLQRSFQNETNAVEKEVEDEEGNIMSEKMMNDLKKQGLL